MKNKKQILGSILGINNLKPVFAEVGGPFMVIRDGGTNQVITSRTSNGVHSHVSIFDSTNKDRATDLAAALNWTYEKYAK